MSGAGKLLQFRRPPRPDLALALQREQRDQLLQLAGELGFERALQALTASAGRVPAHDLDAEAAVISACLLDPRRIPTVEDILEGPEDFYSEANGRIWMAIVEVARSGEAVDITTVVAWLRDREWLAHLGGPSYVAGLADATPHVGHVASHAKVVARKARRRRFIARAHVIAAEGYGDVGDEDEWMTGEVDAMSKIALVDPGRDVAAVSDALKEAFEYIAEADRRKGQLLGLSVGLGDLDRLTAGLHAGDTTMVAGPTGGGKSALVGNIAVTVASTPRAVLDHRGAEVLQPQGVVIFSQEMPRRDYAARMACAQGRVDWHRLRLGECEDDDWRRLNGAAAWIGKLPILIEDEAHLSTSKIRARLRRAQDVLARRYGAPLSLVVIDYLQLLDGSQEVERGANRERQVAELARRIRVMAKDFPTAAWLVLSQLNEDGKLRESRAVEQHAVGIWVVEWVRPPKARDEDLDVVETLIKIEKQRSGPYPRTARCWQYRKFTLFTDIAPTTRTP